MKTAIALGAGASAAEGAPMQKDLFKKYQGEKFGQLLLHLRGAMRSGIPHGYVVDGLEIVPRQRPTADEGGKGAF